VITDAVALVAVNLCFVPAGFGVLRVLGGELSLRSLPRRAGLAYLTGLAAAGVVLTWLLLAGASLALWQFFLVCALLAALALVPRRRLEPPRPPVAPWRLAPLFALLTAAFLVVLALDLYHQPLWTVDAWSIWTTKARSIVALGHLDPAFLRSTVSPDYPILLPAVEAVDLRAMGHDTVVLHLQFWLELAAFLAAALDLLSGRVRSAVLWPVIAALAVAPTIGIQAAYGLADVPLAVLVALCFVCAWRWTFEDDRFALGLLAVLGAGAVSTKSEGLFYVGALFGVVLVLLRHSRPRALLTLGAAGVVALGILPWRIYARAHDLHDWFGIDRGNPLVDRRVQRIPEAAVYLAKEIVDPTMWLLVSLFGLAAAVLAWRAGRRRETALALAPLALALLVLDWVYWNTPIDFRFQLQTSGRRVVVSLVLSLALLAPLLLEAALTSRDAGGEARR
jgi:hypothetical protein